MYFSKYIIFVFCILFSGCAGNEALLDDVFSSRYESKLISRGDNRPDFDRSKDSIQQFMVALHKNINITDFKKRAGWNDDKLKSMISFLEQRNWIHYKNGTIKPSIFVATEEDAVILKKYALPVANVIADSIQNILPVVKEKYSKSNLFVNHSFDDLSFLILSNVLLDNWQIRFVEQDFLKTENRPLRHGKFYYAGVNENKHYPEESFGIYGNQTGIKHDNKYVGIYGNNRVIANQLLKNNNIFRDSILAHSPIVTRETDKFFCGLSKNFRPVLLSILNQNKDYASKIYNITDYAKEISFEEFFIWWYHFIYTATTDILKDRGVLYIPHDKNYFYIISVN